MKQFQSETKENSTYNPAQFSYIIHANRKHRKIYHHRKSFLSARHFIVNTHRRSVREPTFAYQRKSEYWPSVKGANTHKHPGGLDCLLCTDASKFTQIYRPFRRGPRPPNLIPLAGERKTERVEIREIWRTCTAHRPPSVLTWCLHVLVWGCVCLFFVCVCCWENGRECVWVRVCYWDLKRFSYDGRGMSVDGIEMWLIVVVLLLVRLIGIVVCAMVKMGGNVFEFVCAIGTD